MTLREELLELLPELTLNDFDPHNGTISLRDDSDGLGAYIEVWNYPNPIPAGLKLGK